MSTIDMQPQPEPYDMTQPPPDAPAPKTKRGRTILIAVGTGLFAFVIGVAAGGGDTPTTDAGSTIVTTTPAACGDALTAAEDLFVLYSRGLSLNADALGLASEGIQAAVVWDAAELDSITDDLGGIAVDIEGIAVEVGATQAVYEDASEACRN
jgi:hypothetical protein